MITTAEEYLQQLWSLYNENIPTKAILLPSDETIYEIDLNSRVIKTPSFLSVKKDQAAETIYFLIDRFAGEIDLANTACLIQYRNEAGQDSFYPVPFYDITTYSSHTVNEYVEIYLNSGTYKKNKYYVLNENGDYVLSSGDFDKEEIYFMKNNISSNRKYIPVDVAENNYQPDKYYYFVNNYSKVILSKDTYEINKYYIKVEGEYVLTSQQYDPNQAYYIKEITGTFMLDHGTQLNPNKQYYISIDKRFIKAHVEYSNYKIETYYILDSNNEMVLSMGQFNPNIEYYTLVDKPKILFPWQIGNVATEAAGLLEFSIRFYQIDTPTGRLVYNLNTLPAKSKILDTMEVEIRDDQFEDVMDDVASTEYNEILGRQATVLEDLYFKIAMKNDVLYWIEA